MLDLRTNFECTTCSVEAACINPTHREPVYDEMMTLVGLTERGQCDLCFYGESEMVEG